MGYGGTSGAIDKIEDPAGYRFVCGWCAIRVCVGCRDELRFQDNRLMDLLRVLREREGRDGPRVPNAPLELGIGMQPRAPGVEGAVLPVDSPAPAQAIRAEELSNLSPGFSGGSTPMSRPSIGSSKSKTGGPRRRLAKFEEYDGAPCWPPPTRGKSYPILDERAELTNIEEYPRQRISPHPPVKPPGVNPQRGPRQHLPDRLQWKQRGPTPQPRGPFIPQRRSPELDLPEPRQESGGESEAPVEPTDGRQTHQQAELPHQAQPPRQSSPLLQVSPPREPLPPRQPSPPQREATPRSTLGVIERQGVPLALPPKSPKRKESPPISAPKVSMIDASGTSRVDGPEVSQSKVIQPEVKDPEAKQTETKQPEVSWAQIEKPEVKSPEAKQQPTPRSGRPQVGKEQERRAESPLPSPGPQRGSTPRPSKSPRSTPSPRLAPTQAIEMGEKPEGSSYMGCSMPQQIKKLPEPEVLKPEPVPKPMPKPNESALAAKQEKSVQSPTKQEKALPEPPKTVKSMIGDFAVLKPGTPPEERPVYPTKPEPNIDLSYYNLMPTTTCEKYKLPDDMQLPEIDFGGALDTMAMTDGTPGRPTRAHEKPPAAPTRPGGEEKEGKKHIGEHKI
ncbi:hypothetical protein C7212DRAFT_353407 [Tuber magnatum]|uniref:Uncharacterized protein n=1 Tax=Tuber magnatum TaxID=42249 RepID=A0A317SLA0_9PEZI|nr:hypothetical protein C7212DRAFT_353407 [Tuber magnatum]